MHATVQLVELLGGLLEASDADQDAATQSILEWLCRDAGIDCASLFQDRFDGWFYRTHCACADPAAVDPVPVRIATVEAIARIVGDAPLIVQGSGKPTDDIFTSALLLDKATQLAIAPMRKNGQLIGFASFGISDQADIRDKLPLLSSMTGLIGSALSLRATERQGKELASRLTATLDALPNLVFEVDANGRYTSFMAGPEHLMAAAKESLVGNTMKAILPPDAARISEKALNEVMATGRTSDVHYRLDLADGPHDFELTGALKPASDPDGPPSAIFLVRDVTEETHLREELRHLGKIVEVMDNLVVITGVERQVIWVNAAFERQTGWQLKEIFGKDLATLVRCSDSDPAVAAQVTKAVAEHRSFKGEIINQDRYGQKYWVDFNIWPLFEKNGQFSGYVSVETVVSRLKEQEAAMKDLATQASAAQIRLENALMALPDSVIVLDADERVIAVNGVYHRTFPELSDIAVPGAALVDLIRSGLRQGLFRNGVAPKDLDSAVLERLATYQQQKRVEEVELHNGKWLRLVSMRTSDGGCVAVGTDITANKKHVAALDAVNNDLVRALQDRDATRQRLLRIMDGAEIGTWEWDIVGDTLKVGGHWGEIIGFTTHTFAVPNSVEFRSLVHPEDLKFLDETRFKDLAAENNVITREFRMKHRDGHWVWILSRSRVTERTKDGSASVVVGVHIDISDRKRLEQELLTSQTYLSHIMETNVAAVAVMTDEGLISFANAEAERVLGMVRTEIVGREYRDTIWKIERVNGGPLPESDLPFRRATAEGVPIRDMRFAVYWPDGTRRVLSCNAAPLRLADGKVEVVTSFSDITEQLAATTRLEDALARAEEMSRAKSTFLANMSHEIRTPLNGVLGMAEVLESLLTDASQKRMIQTIRTSGDTLLTVLNGILDMSKIEAGKMVLDEVEFSPLELSRQLQAIYSIQAEEKGLHFEVFSSVGCETMRIGDAHRIQQILNNLLNNAVKFTERGGVQMKMNCRPGKPFVIEISDTGIGMDEDQVNRVFESFEQGDGSTTRRFGGTGLGLSIVRQLVALMGGDTSISSKPGLGTKIRVTLPLPESDSSEAITAGGSNQSVAVSPLNGVVSPLGGLKFLFADDNAVNLQVLTEMLSRSGAVITEVENGQQAVDAWVAAHDRGEPFALLFLDITMPVRDGLSALAEIRSIEETKGLKRVPAIAITANAMADQVSSYILGGFSTHLAKPFAQRDLLHAVNMLLTNEP